MLGESVCALKKNAEASVVSSKEIGLEVNADKTKYLVMSQDQIAGRSHSIKIDNSSFERVEEFKYLGTTLTYLNSIQEEIKSKLKSGNAWYYLMRECLVLFDAESFACIILPFVLCGCETWSLTLREECRPRVFENRLLMRIFGSRRDEVTGAWRKLHNEELK